MNSRADWEDTVKKGYNRVAHLYQQDRAHLHSKPYLRAFLELLSAHSHVLDLGCGSGAEVVPEVLRAGHLLTGIDISETQVHLAQKQFPRAEFLVGDIATLRPKQFGADGVIMLYSMFHIPRAMHAQILATIATFLPPGGPLLISMGDVDFEGTHAFYGTTMWSSHFGPAKNRELIASAGFEIRIDKLDTSGSEKHQMIVAVKR